MMNSKDIYERLSRFLSFSDQLEQKRIAALNFVKEVKSRFQDQPERFTRFRLVLEDVTAQRMEVVDGGHTVRLKPLQEGALARLTEVLKGHSDLVRKFNLFVPPTCCHMDVLAPLEHAAQFGNNSDDAQKEPEKRSFASEDAIGTDGKNVFEASVNFVSEKFNDGRDKKTPGEVVDGVLYNESEVPFTHHPCILEESQKFTPVKEATPLAYNVPQATSSDEENSGEMEVGKTNDKKRKFEEMAAQRLETQGLTLFQKVRQRLSNSESYRKFLKPFFYYTTEEIGKAELKSVVTSLIGEHSDLMDDIEFFLDDCKNMDKGIHKFDLSEAKRCSPSYCLLPQEVRPNNRSGTGLESEVLKVLNNTCVCVPAKDTSYRRRTVSRNESRNDKIMNQFEDDLFHMDVMLGWLRSAITFAKKLLDEPGDEDCNKERAEEGCPIQEAGEGNAIHFLRCVEHMYGDYGLDVLDIFRENPAHTASIILPRLEGKLEELKEFRSDFISSL